MTDGVDVSSLSVRKLTKDGLSSLAFQRSTRGIRGENKVVNKKRKLFFNRFNSVSLLRKYSLA